MTQHLNNSWDKLNNYFLEIEELGFQIDVSRMVIDESGFNSTLLKSEKVFSEIQKIEKGEIANPDENRQVGHYWLRAPELSPNKEISSLIEKEINKVKNFSSDILKSSEFKNAIITGIGGSALGPQLLKDCFYDLSKDSLNLFFADNTDPDGISRILKNLKLSETLIIVVSKSGSTVETVNAYKEITAAFSKENLNINQNSVAITSEHSKLDKLSKDEGWIESFYIWDWVGGRTSIFSAVGLLPLSLLGLDIDKFLNGAKLMDSATREESALKNPASLLASCWHYAGDGKGNKNMVVLPYKDRLLLFSRYLQQLVMESLGKEFNLEGEKVEQGISVFGNKGSTDQHAFVQQLRGGRNDFFACFIEILKDFPESQKVQRFEVSENATSGDYLAGFLHGTREALSEKDRQNLIITLQNLDETSLAALIALFERAVGIYASMIGVNAYHQPGVEAGKKAASSIIKTQNILVEHLNTSTKESGQSDFSLDEISETIKQEKETLYRILEQLAANGFQTKNGQTLLKIKKGKPKAVRYKLE